MAKKDEIVDIPVDQLPKVKEFVAAKTRLDAFKELHGPIFERYGQLVEEYNRALEDADKDVRARKVSSGPFAVHTAYDAVDALALYETVGATRFKELGGEVKEERKYTIDKTRFFAAVSKDEVKDEVVQVVVKNVVTYKKPEPISDS